MDNCNFSLEHYKELMNLIITHQYRPVFFHEATFTGKEIIIRHDIDTDLIRALDFANIEKELGIRSTFFLWIGSPFYNIFEKSHKDVINSILEMGHHIGLHFYEKDYSVYPGCDLTSLIRNEAKILELAFKTKIHAVSFHIPSEAALRGEYKLSGEFCNAYHEDYFKKYKYLSDSSMNWREGCLCKYLRSEAEERIQVLMHTLWWQKSDLTRKHIVDNLVENKIQKLHNDLNIAAPFYKTENTPYMKEVIDDTRN